MHRRAWRWNIPAPDAILSVDTATKSVANAISQTALTRGARRERRVDLMKVVTLCLLVNGAAVSVAAAQSPPETTDATPVSTVERSQSDEDDDAVLSPAEPDFVVVNLPTAMRLPLFKGNFRLTHRFAGNLRRGDFSQQAGNLFGVDQGAIIGFEYRFAVARHVQAAFYRSSFDKTIQLYGKYDAIRQRGSMPVSMSAIGSVEGTNNFREKYAPAIGVAISRFVGTRVAVYLTPVWTGNTAASLDPIAHDHDGDEHTTAADSLPDRRSTTFVGVGGRVRLRGTTYVAAEIVPRVGGYAPDQAAYGVSIEKRVGKHMFSLTFTNSFGTTFAQVARGGAANTLYLGFNLGRKFF
jgi:hypothetical protein